MNAKGFLFSELELHTQPLTPPLHQIIDAIPH